MMIRAMGLMAVMALPVTASAQPTSVAPETVIASLTGDWNDDGGMDRALLIDNEDGADLLVYMSEGEAMKPVAFAPALVWGGAMWGTQPSLRLSPTGGLQVVSGNDAIGRSRWEQTLTLAWRNDRMVVAGLTASSHDTLDPDAATDCDVNLLTGKGMANGKPIKVAAGGIAVTQWSEDNIPEACR